MTMTSTAIPASIQVQPRRLSITIQPDYKLAQQSNNSSQNGRNEIISSIATGNSSVINPYLQTPTNTGNGTNGYTLTIPSSPDVVQNDGTTTPSLPKRNPSILRSPQNITTSTSQQSSQPRHLSFADENAGQSLTEVRHVEKVQYDNPEDQKEEPKEDSECCIIS